MGLVVVIIDLVALGRLLTHTLSVSTDWPKEFTGRVDPCGKLAAASISRQRLALSRLMEPLAWPRPPILPLVSLFGLVDLLRFRPFHSASSCSLPRIGARASPRCQAHPSPTHWHKNQLRQLQRRSRVQLVRGDHVPLFPNIHDSKHHELSGML